MLQKLREDEEAEERPAAELGSLRNTDWVRRRGREPGLRRGRVGADTVCLPLPTPGPAVGAADAGAAARREAEEGAGEAVQPPAHRVPAHPLRDAHAGHPRPQLQTPQGHGERRRAAPAAVPPTGPVTDTARGPSALSQVDGDIPPRVKKDAHELILDFIRSRPPLKQVGAGTGTPPWHGGAWAGLGGVLWSHGCCPHQDRHPEGGWP